MANAVDPGNFFPKPVRRFLVFANFLWVGAGNETPLAIGDTFKRYDGTGVLDFSSSGLSDIYAITDFNNLVYSTGTLVGVDPSAVTRISFQSTDFPPSVITSSPERFRRNATNEAGILRALVVQFTIGIGTGEE